MDAETNEGAALSRAHQGVKNALLAGASVNHNRIVGNVFGSLRNAVKGKPCETFFGDGRVWIEARDF